MGAREVLAKLRTQMRHPEVERLEAEAVEEEREAAYVAALHEERRGVEARLAIARRMVPTERVRMGFEPEDAEPPTGAMRVAAADRRLAAIDAELRRVGE